MLDVGCGTGSLSLLLAEAGHQVTGIDFSPAMIQRAIDKARDAELEVDFLVGDAANPPSLPEGVDVLLGRHILWAMSETPLDVVLDRWAGYLVPGGSIVMIEGFWHTGVGLKQEQIVNALPVSLRLAHSETLSDYAELWGAPVADERYVLVASR